MIHRVISIFVISCLLLGASEDFSKCNTALKNVTKFYYEKEYHLSKEYAYKALESCQKHPSYDFTPLYNYIIANDLKLQELFEAKMLEASTI